MAKLEPQFRQASELSVNDIAFIVAIGRRQAVLMDELEAALQAGEEARALELARKLVRLEHQISEQGPPAAA